MHFVKISDKNNITPATKVLCFWCQEPKNVVVLFGQPTTCSAEVTAGPMDHTPCKACQEKLQSHVWIVEAAHTPQHIGQTSTENGLYPTGRYVQLNEEQVDKLFGSDTAQIILQTRMAYMNFDAYQLLADAASE